MERFVIKSTNSDAELIFSEHRGDDFVVEFRSFALRVTLDVCGYTDPMGIAVVLKEIASGGMPWTGARTWKSLEGEFSLSAECNNRGHVLFEVRFDRVGIAEEWSASAALTSELGLLPGIAAAANEFFGGHSES